MNKISGVYLIRNTITNDCYIGSSVDVKRRLTRHKCSSEWKNQPNNPMYIDMQTIGKDKFTFEILEECDKSILRVREQYYIKKLKPTYNNKRAFQTEEEYIKKQCEDAKKWRETHKEQYLEYHREYQRQYNHKRKAEQNK